MISRPLSGCIIGLSVSETEELGNLGYDSSDVNRFVVRLAESLLSFGGRLVFGHDWRPGGVMEAVAALALRYSPPPLNESGRRASSDAPVINLVAHPDVPFLARGPTDEQLPDLSEAALDLKHRLVGVVDARQVSVPDSRAHSAASRADKLTLLRRELARIADVRICAGGKTRDFQGRMPGVLEEAMLTINEDRPVFAAGLFGGATDLVIEGLSGGSIAPRNRRFSQQYLAEIKSLGRTRHQALTDEEENAVWSSSSIEQSIELLLRATVKYQQTTLARKHPAHGSTPPDE